MTNSKRKYKTSVQKRARDRGRAFEYRVANMFDDGYVYTGQDGDVVTGDWIHECKYRTDFRLRKLTELSDWIEQAKRNAKAWEKQGKPKKWVVTFTGGGRSGTYMIVDKDTFKELKEAYDYREAVLRHAGVAGAGGDDQRGL